ncbi:MAG: S8 family serine peptidase [Lewinellaceae bacterium]|nr:S8 family serine peptidase [Saprospiraceae bacterium]MCB9341537.1 S8 family serine peptidase [Lewinellaceae bacterium]
MKNLFLLACLLAMFQILPAQTENWPQKIDPALLENLAADQAAPFIAVLKQQADVSAARQLKTKDEKATYVFNQLSQTALSTQAGLIAFLEQKNVAYQSLFIVNAIEASGDIALLEELAQRPDVGQIIANPTSRFDAPVDRGGTSERTIEWGIEKINADDVWAMGYRGQGVTVGGQDTGYEWEHPALKNEYRGYDTLTGTADHNYNWHDAIHSISPLASDSLNPCGLDSPFPCDDHNHGTHTMGTMVGLDGDNEIGVAPGAKWCACRNMERGNGSPFTYLECFQWFIAPTDLNNENPDPTKAPHVVNNSWYCSAGEGCNATNLQLMNLAVNNLRLAGTVVVVSAGNSGSGCSSIADPPALFESSFSVGATDINDTIAGFSSRGPVMADGSGRLKPNVSAPGVFVRSSIRNGGYANFSGTSMAGPHVVGLVALMISANPDLAGQVDTIENIIERTAVPLFTDQECGGVPGTLTPNNTYGYGRVDALAAVAEALSLVVSQSVEEVAGEVSVYPNPFSDMLYFKLGDKPGTVQIEMLDMNGRLLLERRYDAFQGGVQSINLAHFPTGVYYYRLLQSGNVLRGKVVKK